MKKYETAVMEIIEFDSRELLLTATSFDETDNKIPEIPDIEGGEGGIFG